MKSTKLRAIGLWLFFTAITYGAQAQKGSLYAEFPESFEKPGELIAGYKKKNLKLGTGEWYFFGARVDSTGNDHPTSGKYAARFVGDNAVSALVEMKFDLKEGASKLVLWYSSYGAKADKPCAFRLEYSDDEGKNWKAIGDDIIATSKSKQATTYDVNLKGSVRFRINKLGLGITDDKINNGRLSIDDIAIYKN